MKITLLLYSLCFNLQSCALIKPQASTFERLVSVVYPSLQYSSRTNYKVAFNLRASSEKHSEKGCIARSRVVIFYGKFSFWSLVKGDT